MSHGQGLMLFFGLCAIGGGVFLLTRRGGGDPAVYARRIAGMMLIGGGFALSIFSFALAGHG